MNNVGYLISMKNQFKIIIPVLLLSFLFPQTKILDKHDVGDFLLSCTV